MGRGPLSKYEPLHFEQIARVFFNFFCNSLFNLSSKNTFFPLRASRKLQWNKALRMKQYRARIKTLPSLTKRQKHNQNFLLSDPQHPSLYRSSSSDQQTCNFSTVVMRIRRFLRTNFLNRPLHPSALLASLFFCFGERFLFGTC